MGPPEVVQPDSKNVNPDNTHNKTGKTVLILFALIRLFSKSLNHFVCLGAWPVDASAPTYSHFRQVFVPQEQVISTIAQSEPFSTTRAVCGVEGVPLTFCGPLAPAWKRSS
jgi:hypothetical protein